jgi:hypothetical protein
MLDVDHQRFLGKYFLPHKHYSISDAPIAVGTSPHSSQEDLNAVMHIHSTDNIVQYWTLENPNIDQSHIHSALHSPDFDLSWSAAEHPKISKENLLIALNHKMGHVRAAARMNPAYREHFPAGYE